MDLYYQKWLELKNKNKKPLSYNRLINVQYQIKNAMTFWNSNLIRFKTPFLDPMN